MLNSLLIIPDSHSHPDYDGDRFLKLGAYIASYQPECIVCLGDFWDMPALSRYDVGKLSAEGRRVTDDIACGKRDMAALLKPLRDLQDLQRSQHRKVYTPQMEFLVGNHEARIDTAVSEAPSLFGFLKLADLELEKDWNVTPFKRIKIIEGISFSHYFPNRMGRALSGVSPARTLLSKLHCSAVAGHSHLLDFSQETLPDGRKIFALHAGCYNHPRHDEGWSTGTDHHWHRGVVLLRGVADGYFKSMSYISMHEIEES